ALDGVVEWDADLKMVRLNKYTDCITLKIGSDLAYHNGDYADLDTPPVIMDGRTMLPLRFVATELGFKVEWDGVDTITVEENRDISRLAASSGVCRGDDGNLYCYAKRSDHHSDINVVAPNGKMLASYVFTGTFGTSYADNDGNIMSTLGDYGNFYSGYNIMPDGTRVDITYGNSDEYDNDGNRYLYVESYDETGVESGYIIKNSNGETIERYCCKYNPVADYNIYRAADGSEMLGGTFFGERGVVYSDERFVRFIGTKQNNTSTGTQIIGHYVIYSDNAGGEYKYTLKDGEQYLEYPDGSKVHLVRGEGLKRTAELPDGKGMAYFTQSAGGDGGGHIYGFTVEDEDGGQIDYLKYRGYINICEKENGEIFKYGTKDGKDLTIEPDGEISYLN
ncbi:MAG: copper amine oxidase N-terminal domain-containing protein, partial [Firmicutes bacterium]|nr:copper amine oxidase N-terminal domain-containing protein [Bacillota bacterium]